MSDNVPGASGSEINTYMNRHLDAWFRAGAFEDDVEAVRHVEGAQGRGDVLLCSPELLVGGLGLVDHGQTVSLLREALLDGEVETSLIDIDGNYPSRTGGFRESASEETDCSDTEDKDCRRGLGVEADTTSCVDEDGEGFR